MTDTHDAIREAMRHALMEPTTNRSSYSDRVADALISLGYEVRKKEL